MSSQPASVILVVAIVAVCSVFQRSVKLVSALDDDRPTVRGQERAPEIDTVEEKIILLKGASWNFTCKFHQPITWRAYAPSYYWEPGVDNIDFKTDDPDKPYRSILMLVDASAQHVGRYYCIKIASYNEDQEEELDDMVAEYQASTVYVYVNDPEHPLVPIEVPVFRCNQYEDFVIPCKPTLPDIEVELLKDLDENLVENIEYSSTQGFKLSFSRLEDGGSYYCQVKDEPEHRIQFVVMINENYKSEEELFEQLPKPSIHSYTKDYVPLGQQIRLVCQINLRAAVNVDMIWKAPPNLRIVSKNDVRIKIGPLKVTPAKDAEHRNIASQELIVERTTKVDDGTYRCEVQDINKHWNYQSFKLHVRESREDYVMLREVNNLDHVDGRYNVNGITPPIVIVIEYISYPTNITYYWVNDIGFEITTGHHGKYELSHTDTHVKLRVNDPTVYDTGNYTLFVKAGNAKESHRIAVLVFAKPTVQLESRFVKPNEKVSFTCRSIGYPRPEISIAFLPCLSKPWTNCSLPTSPSAKWDTRRGTSETLIINARTHNMTSTQPGVVYCKATNTEGSEVTQADLLISDLPDAITLVKERPKESITVGDHVTLVCSALVYNYTNDITFVHNNKELQKSDRVSHNYSAQLYAWQARLDIEHVTKDHGGSINCRVKTMKNAVESRAFHLEVLDPVAPMIKSGKNNEILSVDLQDPLKLECDVVGTPDPKIVWLKDGKPVQRENNNNRVQLTKTTLNFEYLKMDDLGIFKCRAENKIGTIEKYWKVDVRTAVVRKSTIYIILGVFVGLIVGMTLLICIYCKKRKKVKAMKEADIVNFEEVSEIHSVEDGMKMSRANSESEESNFDFVSFNSDRHSPTIGYNLSSKRHKTRDLPEEIPMLDGNQLSSVANVYNSDSETKAITPKPRERKSKRKLKPEYINVKNYNFGGDTSRAPLCDIEVAQRSVT